MKISLPGSLFFLLVFAGSFPYPLHCARAEETSWPSFLGLGRAPADPKTSRLPLEWSPTENIAWRCDLTGYGQSSPVVWNEKAFVTSVDGTKKTTLLIHCIDVQNGNLDWTFQKETANEGDNTPMMSRAAPTPVVDPSGLYVFFEGGDVIALTRDGKERWSKNLVAEYGPISTNHGISSSLAQDDQTIYVWVQRKEDPYLLALQKSTGEVKWKSNRPAGVAWSSPTLAPMPDGSIQLVLSTSVTPPRGDAPPSEDPNKPSSGYLAGIEPSTGNELWRLEGMSGNSSQTPIVIAPGKLLIGASAGREGGSTKEAIATNGVVEVKSVDGKYRAEYVWHSGKGSCGFGSPCFHNGLVYLTDKQGIVYCLDAETGKEHYFKRLGSSTWATPIGVGERVYFFGETGKTEVLRTATQFESLASNALWIEEEPESPPQGTEGNRRGGPASQSRYRQYAAAISDDTILIRRGDALFAIRNPADATIPSVRE